MFATLPLVIVSYMGLTLLLAICVCGAARCRRRQVELLINIYVGLIIVVDSEVMEKTGTRLMSVDRKELGD